MTTLATILTIVLTTSTVLHPAPVATTASPASDSHVSSLRQSNDVDLLHGAYDIDDKAFDRVRRTA